MILVRLAERKDEGFLFKYCKLTYKLNLRDKIANKEFRIILLNNITIGYIYLDRVSDLILSLNQIYILHKYRHNGYARRALDLCYSDIIRKQKQIIIAVIYMKDTEGKEFMEKLGYRPDYVTDTNNPLREPKQVYHKML